MQELQYWYSESILRYREAEQNCNFASQNQTNAEVKMSVEKISAELDLFACVSGGQTKQAEGPHPPSPPTHPHRLLGVISYSADWWVFFSLVGQV